jgi:hypothetical protein
MTLTREYMHHRSGYRFGTRCSWVRIYGGETRDAPVVVCEEIEDDGEAGFLAGEVVLAHFPEGLPDLPRPMLWIEHRPSRSRRGPGRYSLLTFPSYVPRPVGAGFVRRVTLGTPVREKLTPLEASLLTGEIRP